MANLGQNFDAATVPTSTFDCIPKGEYILRITESDVVPNSAQTGQILKLTVEVVQGQYAGRKIFDQINLSNPNEMAVKIGREKLSGYCHATGVIQLGDSQQLHGIPFSGKVIIKEDKTGQYDDRNEIRSSKKLEAAQGGAAQSNGAPAGFGGSAPAGFGGAPAGFGGNETVVGQGNPQLYQQAQGGVAQGGYGQVANQGQQQVQNQGHHLVAGFAPSVTQGQQAAVQGFDQAQGQQVQNQQVAVAGFTHGGFQPNNNAPVDNSAVPDMNFGGQMQNQGQAVQQVQNQQVQGAAKAPWEQ